MNHPQKGLPFNRIQIKLHKLVCDDLRVRNLANTDAARLSGIYLDAELQPLRALRDRAKHPNAPIAPNVVVALAEGGAK